MDAELPLRDYHLPPPIGWWPTAPGWWLLALLLASAAAAGAFLLRRHRRRAVHRLAAAELRRLQAAPLTDAEKLSRLSILLRRVGLTLAPRGEVAGLTGEAWLQWLDRPLARPAFSRGGGRLLLEGPYRPVVDGEVGELFRLSQEWLQRLPAAEVRGR